MIPEKLEYCPGCGAGSGGNGNWNYDSQCCGDCGYDRINPVTSSMDSMRWTIGAQRQRIADLEQQLSALRAKTEWVPVSERLPDEGVLVIVPLLFGEVQAAKLVNGDWCEQIGGPILNAAGGPMKFTKWAAMPLPTSPTTEEDGQ